MGAPSFLAVLFGFASYDEPKKVEEEPIVEKEPLTIEEEILATDNGFFANFGRSIRSIFRPDSDAEVDSTDDAILDAELPAYPAPETEFVAPIVPKHGWLIYDVNTWVGHGFWPMPLERVPPKKTAKKEKKAKKESKKAKKESKKDKKKAVKKTKK